jgi:hypothetical protein
MLTLKYPIKNWRRAQSVFRTPPMPQAVAKPALLGLGFFSFVIVNILSA